jgi:hypothetical protein
MSEKIRKLFERFMDLVSGAGAPALVGLLIALQIAPPLAFAAIQPERLTQKPKARIGAGVAQDSDFGFDVGLGAANPTLKYKSSDQSFHLNKSILRFGSGSAADQTFEADIGAGGSNPKLKYNNSSTRWEFANDGATYKALGSGSGGGGGGVNLLTSDDNPGFEDGQTPWFTNAPSSATIDSSTPLYGAKSLVFAAAGSGDWIRSAFKTADSGLVGQSCLAGISYKTTGGASGDYSLQVYDGTSVLADYPLPTSTSIADAFVGFTCQASPSVAIRVISNVGSPGTIEIDGPKQSGGMAHLGSNLLLNQFSQAEHVGTLTYAPTASCVWSTSSSTFASYSADTDCATPTVTGKLSAPGTKIPGFVINNALPGDYYVVANSDFFNNAAGNNASWRFSDGTTGFGFANGNAISSNVSTLSGTISYSTSPGNVTIQIQGTENGGGGSADIIATPSVRPLVFDVFRFPTMAQTSIATTSDTALQGEYKLTGCALSPTAATGAYTDFDSPASCALSYVKGTLTGAVLGGSGAGSITFPPVKVGQTFEVCASGQLGSGGGAGYVQIVDNQGNAGEAQFNATTSIVPFRMCTNATSTSLSPMTVKLQGAASGGTGAALQGPGIGTRFLTWSIKDVSSNFPMVHIVKQLQSPSAANMIHATAKIDCSGGATPCTITRQDGSWISGVAVNSAGDYTVTMTAFSSTPNCQCTPQHQTGVSQKVCNIREESGASSTSLGIYLTDTAGSASNWKFFLSCDGPK